MRCSQRITLGFVTTIATIVAAASAACTGLAESCRNLYNPGSCAIGSGVNSCGAVQGACDAICGSVSGCRCERVSNGCDSIWCEYEYWCQPSRTVTCSSFGNRADCNDRRGCEWEEEEVSTPVPTFAPTPVPTPEPTLEPTPEPTPDPAPATISDPIPEPTSPPGPPTSNPDGPVSGNSNSARVSLVKDIFPGASGSGPSNFKRVVHSDAGAYKVFFLTDDGVHGREPWVSDGTPGGTFLLKDVREGSRGSDALEVTATELSGRNGEVVFFSADDGVRGQELWVTDLTPEGTAMVKDIVPGPGGSFPREFVEFGGVVYFVAAATANGEDGSGGGAQLWRTDGTEGGTVLVKDFAGVSFGNEENQAAGADLGIAPAAGGGEDGTATALMYLSLGAGSGGLVRSDGSPSDAARSCSGAPPGEVVCELTGTAVIKFNVHARVRNKNPILNGKMIFVAQNDGGDWEVWSTDGTADGTVPIFSDLPVWRIRMGRESVNGRVIFSVNRSWLFASNGTTGGTVPITLNTVEAPYTSNSDVEEDFGVAGYGSATSFWGAISTGPVLPTGQQLFIVNGISAGDSDRSTLWSTDGTSQGTKLIKDFGSVEPVTGALSPDGRQFLIRLTALVDQVWITDGTAVGTRMLVDLGSFPDEINRDDLDVVFLNDEVVLINAWSEEMGMELWRLDLLTGDSSDSGNVFEGVDLGNFDPTAKESAARGTHPCFCRSAAALHVLLGMWALIWC